MTTRIFFLTVALIGLVGSCTGPTPISSLEELDYTEMTDATGWRLRIYGNGSGGISHDQLPAHHLHYPRGTFAPERPRRRAEACRPADKGPCTRLTHYSARLDSTLHCTCVSAKWTDELMALAIERMDRAVDAGANERSSRMLRRRWLSPARHLVGR